MRSNPTGTSLVYSVLLFGIVLGLAGTAGAQTAQFSSEADAVSGTITKTALGLLQSTITIAPAHQSTTATTGNNDNQAGSDVETAFGVEVSNISGVDDSTDASNTADMDIGGGIAISGAGTLLGGLVTWTDNSNGLHCAPDATIAGQVDCASTDFTDGLAINGTPVPPGAYPAGTTFPVSGSITDPECPLGTETFSGYLETQVTQATGLGTAEITLNQVGLHLVGDATCKLLTLAPLYTTHYDLAVAGPQVKSTSATGQNETLQSETETIVNGPNVGAIARILSSELFVNGQYVGLSREDLNSGFGSFHKFLLEPFVSTTWNNINGKLAFTNGAFTFTGAHAASFCLGANGALYMEYTTAPPFACAPVIISATQSGELLEGNFPVRDEGGNFSPIQQ